jgi:hypothetical protein
MKHLTCILILMLLASSPGRSHAATVETDICICGGTSGGVVAAVDAGADVIMITSLNEWPESTVIEPSSSWPDPYLYLKILGHWKGVTFTAPPALEKQP